jgi:4-amino-4-deoxy-L-arabinose transferase-like glycosyltransferase
MFTRRLLILTISVLAFSTLAHLILLTDLPLLVQAIAALLLAILLPGLLLADLLLGPAFSAQQWLLLALSGIGAGCGVAILAMLLLSYLPGGVSRGQTLLLFDAILAVLLVVEWLTRRRASALLPDENDGDARWLWLSVLLVLVVGASLRLVGLGYSEFQGDEARVMLRASEMLTGYENALMVHQKPPGEILIPAAVYALVGRINEVSARLPFAVANLAGLIALLLLGRRLFGKVAALAAALLMALNGYLVAFGRIVQYQSVIFLLTVLVVLVLVEALQSPQGLSRRLSLAAFLAASGLLLHYEMAGVIVPGCFLLWLLWRRSTPRPRLAVLIAPFAVAIVVGATFYLPYLLHPAFDAAFTYAFGYRIGGGSFPHNNLVDFFLRASLYNSSYMLFLLIGVTVAYMLAIYRRHFAPFVVALIGVVLIGGLLTTFGSPSWLSIAGRDHIWLLFALPLVAIWLLPRVSDEERLVFVWFGSLALLTLFVVARPNSHVYTFFIPWMLLVGAGLQLAWGWLARVWNPRGAGLVAGVAGALMLLIFGNYLYQLFVRNDVEVLRTWRENRPTGYWQPFDEPPDVAIFGFPLRNGWKVVGTLYAREQLSGNFETNAKPEVVDWYTRGAGVCPRDVVHYFLADTVEITDDDRLRQLEAGVANEYRLAGWAGVRGAERLRLYDLDGEGDPVLHPVEEIEATFDRELSAPQFVARRGKVVAPHVQVPIDVRLGDAIQLVGYTLDEQEVVAGEDVHLRLVWHALGPVDRPYSVFTQVIDLATTAKAGQRDGMPVCDRSLTNTWNPGDVIEDPFTIPIAPDAAAGEYHLIVGMYDVESGQRLPVTSASGEPLGDFIDLGTIRVKGSQQ